MQLRDTMREMVEDYSRQLDLRDNTIRELQNRDAQQQTEVSMLVYKENETLKQENRMLRDKVVILEDEINRFGNQQSFAQNTQALEEEIGRLNRILQEKEQVFDRDMADQKNEWAEIYGAQKSQYDQQAREIVLLTQENETLLTRLEMQGRQEMQGKGCPQCAN